VTLRPIAATTSTASSSMRGPCARPGRLRPGYGFRRDAQSAPRLCHPAAMPICNNVHRWTLDFIAGSPTNERYRALSARIGESLAFHEACGITPELVPNCVPPISTPAMKRFSWANEQALTRIDSTSGDWYCTSAHLLWIGDRTRQPDGAHVEFCRGIKNPLGLKMRTLARRRRVLKLIDILNPENKPGRITLICRFRVRQGGGGNSPSCCAA